MKNISQNALILNANTRRILNYFLRSPSYLTIVYCVKHLQIFISLHLISHLFRARILMRLFSQILSILILFLEIKYKKDQTLTAENAFVLCINEAIAKYAGRLIYSPKSLDSLINTQNI